MAIYNKQYVADEEITITGLNQVSADAVNTVDNIHTQYEKESVKIDIGVFAEHRIRCSFVSGNIIGSSVRSHIFSNCSWSGGLQNDENDAYELVAGILIPFRKRAFHNLMTITWVEQQTTLVGTPAFVSKSYYAVYSGHASLQSGNYTLSNGESESTRAPAAISLVALAANADITLKLWVNIQSLTDVTATEPVDVCAKLKLLTVAFSLV